MRETAARGFADREAAGRRLADLLRGADGPAPVVLGLPRGGVPVAAEVARALGAPLDAICVRKIGHPANREYGIGAIAEGAEPEVDADGARLPRPALDAVVQRARAELADLPRVHQPVLLIVGAEDRSVLDLNRAAQAGLGGPSELVVVPGATHLFDEPGALEEVAETAARWLLARLA